MPERKYDTSIPGVIFGPSAKRGPGTVIVDAGEFHLLLAAWRCAVATCILLSRDIDLYGEALTDVLSDKTVTSLLDAGALLGEIFPDAYENDDDDG